MAKDLLDDLINDSDPVDYNLEKEIRDAEIQANRDSSSPAYRQDAYANQYRLSQLKQAKEEHDRNKNYDEPDFGF